MQKGDLRVVGGQGVGVEVEEVERLRARNAKRASLEAEIKTLREALAQVVESMRNGGGEEEDRAKMGAVVARLSDSIVRAMVAQQGLSAQDEGFTWLRAQFDRMLRELGYGEET